MLTSTRKLTEIMFCYKTGGYMGGDLISKERGGVEEFNNGTWLRANHSLRPVKPDRGTTLACERRRISGCRFAWNTYI